MINDIYEVDRKDYKSFVNRLYKDKFVLKEENNDDFYECIFISKATDKEICGRKCYKSENENQIPEKYYIINYPEDDEWGAPVPKRRVVLDDPKQIQAFLDGYTAFMKQRGES